MKKIFLSALAVFIVSIIGFIASSIIFGRGHGHYVTPVEYGKAPIFRGDYTNNQSWKVNNEFRYVTINSAGVKTVIGRSKTNQITVNVENPGTKTIHAEAVYEGDELTLEFRPTNITFDFSEIRFGITNWLEDIFTGNSDIIVTIGFPETIYDMITVQQGSGTMQINDLYSHYYDVEIGSGKCEFNRPASGDFKSDCFELKLGSGTAVFSGMESDRFDIEIGSGNFTLDRLSGDGGIDMGSGKGSIFFCDRADNKNGRNKHEIDMGSGNLTLYYPEDGGVVLYTDFGSGKIEIDGFDHKKTITKSNSEDSNQFMMGSGAVNLDIDMGSGIITIKDTSSYSAPEIISEFKFFPSNSDTTVASIRNVTVITGTESELTDIISGDITGSVEYSDTGILSEGGSASGIDFPGFEINQADQVNATVENTAGDASQAAA